MRKLTFERLADWIVPVLLAGTVQVLFEIKAELADLNKGMAVMAQVLNEHDRRIQALEGRLDRP